MNDDEMYEILRKISLYDVFKIFLKYDDVKINEEKQDEKKYLSKNEVLEQYPLFTESSLSKAVKFQGLEYIKSGRCRYYAKDSIEKWLENQKQKEIYNRFEGIKF